MRVECQRVRHCLTPCEGVTMPRPLDLPDVRQRTGHDCATAAWRTVYQWHYGRNPKTRDLSNPIQGTDPATLEACIRLGHAWQAIGGEMLVEDLAYYCGSWRPVIALISPEYPNSADSHYVVVSGVYRGKVHYQCPERGRCEHTLAEWDGVWRGRGRHADFRRWGVSAWPRV